MNDDEDLLPAVDRCEVCHKPRGEHVGWRNGGPMHDYQEPARNPRPEVIVSAHIETSWYCSRCGAYNDVWGCAAEWMECGKCGRESFLIPFATDLAPAAAAPSSQDKEPSDG